MIRKHFRLKKIALGLAFAAVAVPTAQARVVIDGYTAPASSAAVTHQPKLTGAALVNAPAPVSQQGGTAVKLTGAALVNAPAPVSHITAAGTAIANAKHAAMPAGPNPVVQTASSSGFDWSDAGIGALVAFGAALMLVTALVLGRRHRSGPTGLAST
jgi:hypothetical protein